MRVLGAGLELVAAAIIAVLWVHGYFSHALELVQAAVVSPPTLTPVNIPGTTAGRIGGP